MIEQETINDLIFVAQTTYFVFRNQKDIKNNHPMITTGNKKIFDSNKKLAREKELQEQQTDVIILS